MHLVISMSEVFGICICCLFLLLMLAFFFCACLCLAMYHYGICTIIAYEILFEEILWSLEWKFFFQREFASDSYIELLLVCDYVKFPWTVNVI